MSMEVIFLGVGSSGGSPVIGCECPVCRSGAPRNQRTRCSAHIVVDGVHLQIDTGPDFRVQCLREGIRQIDAVLYSHPHADHLNGIDDLRVFCYRQQGVLPLYGDDYTMDDIRRRFAYALQSPNGQWEKPTLSVNPVAEPFSVKGVQVMPIRVMHGQYPILGFRIGDFAWLTDLSDLPPESLPLLQNLKGVAIDALRETPHPTHSSIDQALAWAEVIGAEETWLIHMTHEVDYEATSARLPAGVHMAWDGLRRHY